MLSHILRTVICYEFDKNIGRMQWKKHLEGQPMHGMEMNFKLHEKDYSKRESLYPGAQLMIFAASNYVGVYYRESETRDEYGEWTHLSCHDSCWRGDGVDRFLSLFEKRIATLGWHDGICNDKWYSKREVSQEFAEELREVTRKSRELKIT